jgi:hypothetical protein
MLYSKKEGFLYTSTVNLKKDISNYQISAPEFGQHMNDNNLKEHSY